MANLRSCGPADPSTLPGNPRAAPALNAWAQPEMPGWGGGGGQQGFPLPADGTPIAPAVRPGAARTPAAGFSLSAAGSGLLKQVETLRLKPYDDQTGADIAAWVRGATIGYGHLILEADWPIYAAGISAAGAGALFDQDAAPFVAGVRACVTSTLTQNEFDALVILAYNIGCPALARSSVVQLVNDPAAKTGYPDLETAWKAWNKSQGKVMQGLVNRRQCEWNIYTLGVYERW